LRKFERRRSRLRLPAICVHTLFICVRSRAMEGNNSFDRLMHISLVATECSTVVMSGALNENLLMSSMVHLVMSAKGKMFQRKSGRYETSGKMSFAFCTLHSGYPISNKMQEHRKKPQQSATRCRKVQQSCTSVYFSVLYCASLYFVVLHCTSLYFIVFHCISLHFIVFRCTLLYFTVLRCTFLCIFVHWCVHCIDLYFVAHWLSLSNIVSI